MSENTFTWPPQNGIAMIENAILGDNNILDFLSGYEGIIKQWKDELSLSINANKFAITLQSGNAIIDNFIYSNDDKVDFQITKLPHNAKIRFDCVALDTNCELRKVKATIIQGTPDELFYPALTRLPQQKIQIPLFYLIAISEVGVFLAKDVRRFITITGTKVEYV